MLIFALYPRLLCCHLSAASLSRRLLRSSLSVRSRRRTWCCDCWHCLLQQILFFCILSQTSWIFCEVSTIFFLVSSLLENASVIFTTENFSQQCFSDLMISFKMTYAHPNLSCTLSQGDICWRYLKNYFWSLCTKLVIHSCQINNREVLSLTPLIAAPMQMFTYTQGCLFTDFRRNLNH